MKKIVISLVIIGVVTGIVLGITGAYFTDEEPIENNLFQAGTLKIKQGENDLPVQFANLMPGVATEPQKLTMGNDGTLDAVIDRIFVSAWEKWGTSAIEPAVFAQKLNITITDEIGKPLWKGRLYDLSGQGNAIDGTDKVFLGKDDIRGEHKTDTRDYWFTFELDSSVSDPNWQGADIKATFTVNATQVKDSKFDAAERLVKNQNNSDNGWDWTEDDNPTTLSGVIAHRSNLLGVTAMGLLRAYEFSGNSDYFDSAEKAAYEIANNYISAYDGVKGADYERTGWKGGGAYTNEDILFLQRIGKYYNVGNLFTTKAEEAIVDRWDAYNNSAQAVYDFIKAGRSGLPDLFYWDLEPLMEATVDAANTVSDSNQAIVLRNNALKLAELIAADQNETGGWFIASWSNNDSRLGQASAIRILQLANDMDFGVDYSQAIAGGIAALLTQQQADGSFKGGDTGNKSIQTTAYAALALETAGDDVNAQKAVDYITSQQLSNGGWYEEEGADEYPESNSEALRAIITVSE